MAVAEETGQEHDIAEEARSERSHHREEKPVEQEPINSQEEEIPSKKTNWTLIIIIVVLVLLCLCCIFPLVLYFWLGDIILEFFNNYIDVYGQVILLLSI